jgi:hypothetical protein
MSLVEHAQRELALLDNDEPFNECIVKAVEAFAAYGHSGGSASAGIHILYDLLQFKNISPLTSDPKEWNHITEGFGGDPTWQSARCAEAFSNDGGKTYYLISENDDPQNPTVIHTAKEVS